VPPPSSSSSFLVISEFPSQIPRAAPCNPRLSPPTIYPRLEAPPPRLESFASCCLP
jgi:hypothetical protein